MAVDPAQAPRLQVLRLALDPGWTPRLQVLRLALVLPAVDDPAGHAAPEANATRMRRVAAPQLMLRGAPCPH